MGSRVKKYRMKAIPSTFSEKGGFNAQFVGDGYTVDARTDILPSVITASGVQVGEGTAWDLVTSFLKACAQRAANTGETVTVGSMMTFGLAIKGWYSNKDSKADKDSVRVTATLLGDLKPTVAFSMSNALDGATIILVTVMSDGCGLGHVRQGAAFRINGKELKMLDGDSVTGTLKTPDGETVTARCPILGSDDDHVDATLPEAFSNPEYAGCDIRFTVRGRCGDPDASPQEKSITAVLDAGETPPGPTPVGPTVTAINDGTFHAGAGNVITGQGMRFADAFPGNHILIKDAQGTDMEAMISTDAEIPVTETRFALSIDEGQPLTDGEEYTFEFDMVDADNQPVTVTHVARWRAS